MPAAEMLIVDLRARSQCLRVEMFRAQLQLCITMASFTEACPRSEKLEAAAQRAAAQGCGIIQNLLPHVTDGERSDLEAKLALLKSRLGNGELPAAAVPPVTVEAAVAEAESGEQWAPAPQARNGHLTPAAPVEALTRREAEVLKHIAEGHSTKQVAGLLGITFKTAACHRYRVMDKLGIHETASLVRYAIRQGMVEA